MTQWENVPTNSDYPVRRLPLDTGWLYQVASRFKSQSGGSVHWEWHPPVFVPYRGDE